MSLLKKIIICLLILGQLDLGWAQELSKSKRILKSELSPVKTFIKELQKKLTPFVIFGEQFFHSTSDKPFFILFRDLHCNYEAQQNIVKTLEIILTQNAVHNTHDNFLVLTEGADGPEDTSFLGKFPDKKVREEASQKFMKEGKITGAEFLSIAKYGEIPIQIEGIEDADLYVENLKAFQAVMGKKQQTDAFVEAAESVMEEIKVKTFSQKLLELDVKENEFEKDSIKLEEYVSYLGNQNIHSLEKLEQYPNLSIFFELISHQESISSERVEEEKNKVIEQLSKKLPKEELNLLIQQSLKLRLGKVAQEDYFGSLEELTKKNLKSERYPSLITYISIVKKQAELNHELLLDEIYKLSEKLKQALATTRVEKELLTLDKNLTILKQMFRLEMTRENLEFVKEHRQIYQVESIIEQLKKCVLKSKIIFPKAFNSPRQIQDLSEIFQASELFYDLALKRDEVMARKALKAVDSNWRIGDSDLKEIINKNDKLSTIHYPQIPVLITGGFHSDGITKILKEAGAGFVVLTPKVNQSHDIKNYLSLMMDQRIRITALDFFHIFGRKLAERFPGMSHGLLKEIIRDFVELGKQYQINPYQLHAWLDQIQDVDKTILDEIRKIIVIENRPGLPRWVMTVETIAVLVLRLSSITANLTADVLTELDRKGRLDRRLYEEVEEKFVWRQEEVPKIKVGLAALADFIYLDLLCAKEREMDQEQMLQLVYQSAQARIKVFSLLRPRMKQVLLDNKVNYFLGIQNILIVIDELEAHRDDYARIVQEYYKEYFSREGLKGFLESPQGYFGSGRANLWGKSQFQKWARAEQRIMSDKTSSKTVSTEGSLGIKGEEEVISDANPLLSISYVGHAMEVKRQVNPDNKPLVAVYAGAGTDISSFLLTTNATEGYFLDRSSFDIRTLKDLVEDEESWDSIDLDDPYIRSKSTIGYGGYGYLTFNQFPLRIVQELKSIGVKRESIKIDIQDGRVNIQFLWTYPGTTQERIYSITYICMSAHSIEDSLQSVFLNKILEQGIDIYYERASLDIPKDYALFMPAIGRALKVGGYVISSDTCHNVDKSPKRFLESNEIKFEAISSTLLSEWWASMMPTDDFYGSKMGVLCKKSDSRSNDQIGLMGKLFFDASGEQIATGPITATESNGVVTFKTMEGAELYDNKGNPAQVRVLRQEQSLIFSSVIPASFKRESRETGSPTGTLGDDNQMVVSETLTPGFETYIRETLSKSVRVIADDSSVKGFSNGEVLYLREDLLKDPIALFHELGEGYFKKNPKELPGRDNPKTVALNPHTYLRGVGKEIGNLPDIEKYSDPAKLIEYIKSKLSPHRQNEAEFALIQWNASQGRTGRALFYGLQDLVFGEEANRILSEKVGKKKVLPRPPLDKLKAGLSAVADIVYLDLLYAKERGLDQEQMIQLAYQSAQARIKAFSAFGKWARDFQYGPNPYQYVVFRYVVDVIDELEAHRDEYAQMVKEYYEEFFEKKGINGLVGNTTMYYGIYKPPLIGKSRFRDWGKADEKIRSTRQLGSQTISKGPLNVDRDAIPEDTNAVLSPAYIAYSMELKKQVNPDNRPLVAVYGGAGSDISSFLLSTNATEGYFVEGAPVDAKKLKKWIEEDWGKVELNDGYMQRKRFRGFGESRDLGKSLEYRIAQELKAMRVNPKTIHISVKDVEDRRTLFMGRHDPNPKKYVKIEFDWTYPGVQESKYSITYIPESIFDIATYHREIERSLLDKVLGRGIDVYYQRAGEDIAEIYEHLMPVLGKVLRPGGCIVSDNCKNTKMTERESGIVDPKPFLEQNGDKFEVVPPTLLMDWWTVIMPSCTPYGSKMNVLRKQPHEIRVEDFLKIIEKRILDEQRPLSVEVLKILIIDFLTLSYQYDFDISPISLWLKGWANKRVAREVAISIDEDKTIAFLREQLSVRAQHIGDNSKPFSQNLFGDSIKKIFESSLTIFEEALEDASREDISYSSFLREVRKEKKSRISGGLAALADFVWIDLKWAEIACGYSLRGEELTQAAQEFVVSRIQGLMSITEDLQKTALGFIDAPSPELQGLNDMLQIIEYIKSHQEECIHAVVRYLEEEYANDDGITPDLNSMTRRHIYGVSGARDWKGWENVLQNRGVALSSRYIPRFLKTKEVDVPSYPVLSKPHVGYAMAVKEMVNPHNEDLTVIYGAAGADISCFLLSTNATNGYFIDPIIPDPQKFKEILVDDWENLNLNDSYMKTKRERGFANMVDLSERKVVSLRLAQELKAMGVEKESIKVQHNSRNKRHMRISFDWIYPGTNQKRNYVITYIACPVQEMASPTKRDPEIAKLLDGENVDIYYQRAGLDIPKLYESFLPALSSGVKPGGFLVTNDYESGGRDSRIFFARANELGFEEQYPSYAAKWWEMMIPYESPYGWKMHIRRKMKESADYRITLTDVKTIGSEKGEINLTVGVPAHPHAFHVSPSFVEQAA